MNQTSISLTGVYKRLYKLRTALQQIQQGKQKAGNQQVHALLKQFRRTLRKAITVGIHPSAKACGIMAMALLLAAETEAQCNTFQAANAVNPITTHNLPGGREPFFVDIDGDGDLDCYVLDGIYNFDAPFLLKNVGTNQLPVYQSAPNESGFPLGTSALPFPSYNTAFVDIDGDGDYDCFIAESYWGNFDVHVKYFENQGTPTSPRFVENEGKNPLSFAGGSYFVTFAFADIDGDGDLDVHIDNDWNAYDMVNTGTRTNPVFSSARNYAPGDWYVERAYYDLNGDGLLDYVDNGTYYQNIGPKKNPKYITGVAGAPNLQGATPHIFTDLNGDGKPEFFDKYRTFYTKSPVPLIDTQTVNYKGRQRVRFSLSPTGAPYTYKAFRNGVPIANSNHPYFIAGSGGVYSFTVTDSCGTGFSLPYQLVFSSAASADKTVNLIAGKSTVKATVYPNPFTAYFTLQLPSSVAAGTVEVLDLQGRRVLSQKITSNRISVGSNLTKGVYLLRVIRGNAVVFWQRIVKG